MLSSVENPLLERITVPLEQPQEVDFLQKDVPPQILPNLPLLTSQQSHWKNIHLAHYCQPAWELPEVQNPQHLVIIPLGHQLVEVDWVYGGQRRNLQFDTIDYASGCVQILPAHVPYSGSWSKDVEFIHFYLEPIFISQIAHEFVNPDKVEFLLELKKIDRLIHQIGLALKADLEVDGVGNGFYADSMAIALSAHLLRHYSTRKHVFRKYDDGLSKQKLREALEYINEHLGENLSLAAIADELGMSQYYFVRLFKQSTGVTPHQYLIQQRVERAKQLLKQPELTITEVALECGFTHQSHFAKYFRQSTGVTPKQFRRL
jgi:AraC family transcriptional regulator